MADISKCMGYGCEKKSNCYRFTATESNRQSFFMNVPIKDGLCKYYWPNTEDKEYAKNRPGQSA